MPWPKDETDAHNQKEIFKLSESIKKKMENAYKSISETSDLTVLNDDLAELVKDLSILGTDLAVSDLFDISMSDCDDHDLHGSFKLKLKAQTLENFVGLLHCENGVWELYLEGDDALWDG